MNAIGKEYVRRDDFLSEADCHPLGFHVSAEIKIFTQLVVIRNVL